MNKELRKKVALLAAAALVGQMTFSSPRYVSAEETSDVEVSIDKEAECEIPQVEVEVPETDSKTESSTDAAAETDDTVENEEDKSSEESGIEDKTEEADKQEDSSVDGSDVSQDVTEDSIDGDKENVDKYGALRYALFSGSEKDDLTYSGWKMTVNGDIHTNANFRSNCSELYINGRCEATDELYMDGWIKDVDESAAGAGVISTCDLDNQILSLMDEKSTTTYDSDKYFAEDTVNLDDNIMVNGSVTFGNTNLLGSGFIAAKNNISFNLNQFKNNEDTKVCYYSMDGDININASNSEINGILYAPHGKVIFNGYDLKVNGRIIADQIILNGSLININASDSDLALFNKAPEVELDEVMHAACSTPAQLNADIFDDGLINKDLQISWSKVSGPGEVEFSNPDCASTEVSASQPGIYEMAVSAYDGQYTTTKTIKVIFNEAPEVTVEDDKVVEFKNPVSLKGQVSDDGMINEDLELTWKKVSGPGEAVFTNPSSAETEVSVSESGVYEFELSAYDGEFTTSKTVNVTFNKAPEVTITAPQSVKPDTIINLVGNVSDDGLMDGNLNLTWSKVSGPGEVTFSNANSAETTMSVSKSGTYVVQLTADDGMLTTSKTATIEVKEYTSYGTATVKDETIELTQLKEYQSGGIWYDNGTNTTNGFEVNFEYWAGGGRSYPCGGADGIILNLAPSKGSFGSTGGDMNFNGKGTYGVEFDSYNNEWDPCSKHIAIINESVSNHLVYKEDLRVDDSTWHKVKVTYKDNTISLYLDGGLELQQGGITLNDEIFVGLSAATGGGINKHIVKNINVTPLEPQL